MFDPLVVKHPILTPGYPPKSWEVDAFPSKSMFSENTFFTNIVCLTLGGFGGLRWLEHRDRGVLLHILAMGNLWRGGSNLLLACFPTFICGELFRFFEP